MRTFEEIHADVNHAFSVSDAEALLRCAVELDEVRTPVAEATANDARGAAYRLRADYVLALEHYGRSLELFEELSDSYRMAHVTLGIGIVHAATGDYPAALEHYHRSLALYEEIDVRGGAAIVTGNIGVVHNSTGDYPAALEHYHRALLLHEELGDQNGEAIVTGNIGNVHLYTGNYAAALEHYHRALKLHEELGDRSSVAVVTDNIGLVYAYTNDYPAALDHFYRALSLYEEIGDRVGVAFSNENVLALFVEMGKDTDAEMLLAIMDDMQIDEPSVRIGRELSRAALQERREDLSGAAETLRRALEESLEYGMRSQAADTHKRLRNLAQKRNDLGAYVEHNNEFTRITEEINGKDTATKLAMQEAERRMAKQSELERTERERIAKEREREQAVLYSTLPKHIADRVIRGEVVNDQIENAAVMFVDIVGFTSITSTLTSQQVITLLDAVFKVCDEACNQNNITRIKTIGDSYLAVAIPDAERQIPNQCVAIANAALQIIERIQTTDFSSLLVATSRSSSLQVALRVGLHCGPVTAGVLGTERLQYDVWGDTVNVASRMESTSEPNRIHISEQFKLALSPLSAKERGLGESSRESRGEGLGESSRESRGEGLGESSRESRGEGLGESSHETDSPLSTLRLTLRGLTEIKGKGPLTTYWLEGR